MDYDFGPERHMALDESLRLLESRIGSLVAGDEVVWTFEKSGWVTGARHLAVPGLGGPEEYVVTQSLGGDPSAGDLAYRICSPYDALDWRAGAIKPEDVTASSGLPVAFEPTELAANLANKLKDAEPYNPKEQKIVRFRQFDGGVVHRSRLVGPNQEAAIKRNIVRNGGVYTGK